MRRGRIGIYSGRGKHTGNQVSQILGIPPAIPSKDEMVEETKPVAPLTNESPEEELPKGICHLSNGLYRARVKFDNKVHEKAFKVCADAVAWRESKIKELKGV